MDLLLVIPVLSSSCSGGEGNVTHSDGVIALSGGTFTGGVALSHIAFSGGCGNMQPLSTITHPSGATDATLAPPSVCNPEGVIRRGACYGY